MKIKKNFHSIWISDNGKLPDQVLENLIEWRKMLPQTWRCFFWTNTNDILPEYLNYLYGNNIIVFNVNSIINIAPEVLSKQLIALLGAGDYKIFSDIFRILLMSIQGLDIFSGLYVDITDTKFTFETKEKLENLDLPHGFAFRLQSSGFDSNVTVFSASEEFTENTPAQQLLTVYFNRLYNWNYKLISYPSRVPITNMWYLLINFSSQETSSLFGKQLKTSEVNAETLLALDGFQDKSVLTYMIKMKESNILAFNIKSFNGDELIFPKLDTVPSDFTKDPFYHPNKCASEPKKLLLSLWSR